MKNTEQTKALIEKYQAEYQAFMDVESFPKYRLELFEIQIDKVNQAGFGSVAQANYSPKTGEHILRICTNLELKKYVVFHEFTHILDAEMYAKNDAVKYAYLSGYTEYHASQVELMALLGAERIDMPLSFSPDLIIDTFPSKQNVLEYINSKHQFVVDMMSGSSFPADIEALKVTIGVLYNYFGLRSICKLQSCYENLGFEKDGFTTGVKAEIRKCIQKNLRTKNDRIPIATVQKMFFDALSLVEARKQERVDDGCGPSLYPYREAIEFLLTEVQKSMKEGVDENGR